MIILFVIIIFKITVNSKDDDTKDDLSMELRQQEQ